MTNQNDRHQCLRCAKLIRLQYFLCYSCMVEEGHFQKDKPEAGHKIVDIGTKIMRDKNKDASAKVLHFDFIIRDHDLKA